MGGHFGEGERPVMVTTVQELSTLELFGGCEPAELERVARALAGTREIGEGVVLCREGETADRWWIVVEGMADVTVRGLYVATIGPGETIGELALLDGEPRNATVTATTDMILEEVEGDGFVEALVETPRLALALLRELAVRLRRANDLSAGPPIVVEAAVPTPAPVVAGPIEYNPFAPGYFANPYVQYAALREHEPVYLEPASGAYLLTRYDDIHRVTRDRALTVEIAFATPTPAIEAEKALIRESGGRPDMMMLRRDGDDHTRLRRLVAKVFTPRAIAAWRERAESVVDRLLIEAAARGEIDVIADYALVLPAQIISEMLGMPHADIPQLRAWSHAMTKTLDPINTPEEEAASADASRSMSAYVENVIADKRAHPADDILTALIEAEETGDRLSSDELLAQVILLYIAGHETTLNLIGNGLTHLFEFPDQLDRLRTDSSLDANAIEELLRFDSPVQFARRIAAESLEIDGVTVPAGSVMLLALAAANRDPRKWGSDADLIDLARVGANEHVSFGGGAHFCLGAALARLEGQIALPSLIRRFPHITPAYDEPAWGARMVLRGVERLPVTLHAR
jgi:cytochrome P450